MTSVEELRRQRQALHQQMDEIERQETAAAESLLSQTAIARATEAEDRAERLQLSAEQTEECTALLTDANAALAAELSHTHQRSDQQSQLCVETVQLHGIVTSLTVSVSEVSIVAVDVESNISGLNTNLQAVTVRLVRFGAAATVPPPQDAPRQHLDVHSVRTAAGRTVLFPVSPPHLQSQPALSCFSTALAVPRMLFPAFSTTPVRKPLSHMVAACAGLPECHL